MTATLRREARPDAIRSLPAAEREEGLRRLADLAVQGAFPDEALPAVVHQLAADAPDVMLHFHDLCEAVRQRGAFDDDPAGYADLHDWSASATGLDRLAARLDDEVAWCLRVLLVGA